MTSLPKKITTFISKKNNRLVAENMSKFRLSLSTALRLPSEISCSIINGSFYENGLGLTILERGNASHNYLEVMFVSASRINFSLYPQFDFSMDVVAKFYLKGEKIPFYVLELHCYNNGTIALWREIPSSTNAYVILHSQEEVSSYHKGLLSKEEQILSNKY